MATWYERLDGLLERHRDARDRMARSSTYEDREAAWTDYTEVTDELRRMALEADALPDHIRKVVTR